MTNDGRRLTEDARRHVCRDSTFVECSKEDVPNMQYRSQARLILAATTIAAVALPLGYVFSQVVVRPVREVRAGLERIAAEDFSSPVEVQNRDELGELAAGVNEMGKRIQARTDQLTFATGLELDIAQLTEPEHVSYPTFDGRQIPALFYRPNDARRAGPCCSRLGSPASRASRTRRRL